ncbi:MAG: toxic anion resistance protein, partial [Exiguobacterium oxidotolerans]
MTHSDNNSWQEWPDESKTEEQAQPTISDPSVDLNLAETPKHRTPVRPVEEMIPSDVPAEQRQKIERLLQVIDLNKSDAVMQFGAPVQRELSQFSDQVLSEVKMKDGGDAGKLLSDLMQRVRQMDPDSLQEKKSFWSNVPVIGRAKKKAETYFLQYEKMSAYLEEVVHNLDRSK